MDATLQNLMAAVEEATDELVDLHRQLVRIPSVNTGAPDSGNETAVCQLLEEVFTREGIRFHDTGIRARSRQYCRPDWR